MRLVTRILALAAAGLVTLKAASTAVLPPATQDAVGVALLPFPYPYQAAVTIASDTHPTEVETFEAVHTLINTRQRILRTSDTWNRLFGDLEIDRREEWRSGIDGFDLPIADSCWLFDRTIGAFAGFDEQTHQPIPHAHAGVDFRDIIDGWIRRGWVDTLHTPGPGPIPREATAAGLAWLQSDPGRRLVVWSDHSYTGTPTCLGTRGERALGFVLKNLAKSGTAVLSLAGMDSVARRFAAWPFPRPFPPQQRLCCHLLAGLLVVSTVWLVVCAASRRFRTPRHLMAGLCGLALASGALYWMRLDFALGDNPGSPFYCADLVSQAGFKFYWLLPGTGAYEPETEERLATPEWTTTGRHSFFAMVTLDDGSRRLAFGRCYKGSDGYRSLELLTDEALRDLSRRHGMSILYTHWANHPKEVLTAGALEGLARLRRFYLDGRVWVAPTAELLQFAFVHTFLDFTTRREAGHVVIDITGVKDPVGGPFVPRVEDLSGLSFESPDPSPIEIRISGVAVHDSRLQALSEGAHRIVRVTLKVRRAG